MMTDPELSSMLLHMKPMLAEVPGDGYKYLRVIGSENFIDGYIEGGWEAIAHWEYNNISSKDVALRCELTKHEIDQHAVYVYPHEKIIGQVQRVLVL